MSQLWVWLSIAIIISTLSVLAIDYSISHPGSIPFVVSTVAVAYLFSIYVYYRLFTLKAVGIAYALSDGIPIALVAVAGVLLFGNKLTMTNMIGIALLVVAVFMISSGG